MVLQHSLEQQVKVLVLDQLTQLFIQETLQIMTGDTKQISQTLDMVMHLMLDLMLIIPMHREQLT